MIAEKQKEIEKKPYRKWMDEYRITADYALLTIFLKSEGQLFNSTEIASTSNNSLCQ